MTQQRECDVVVVGGAGTDYLARGPELPSARHSVQGDRFLIAPGGKGLNAAVAAARLGARAALVACVGADERGEQLLAQLASDRVDARHVRRDAAACTASTLVQVAADGRKQTLGVLGANSHLSPADVDAAAPLLTRATILVVQLEVPVDTVERAVRLARSAGARVILDPAPHAPFPDALLAEVEIIKPNAGEAEALTGIRVEDRATAGCAAEKLQARGVEVVSIAAGEGTLLRFANEENWLSNLPVRTVDTTGAGDAFAGALATALAEGRALVDAARFAHAAAALTSTRLGAVPALPRRPEVLDLLHACSLG